MLTGLLVYGLLCYYLIAFSLKFLKNCHFKYAISLIILRFDPAQ